METITKLTWLEDAVGDLKSEPDIDTHIFIRLESVSSWKVKILWYGWCIARYEFQSLGEAKRAAERIYEALKESLTK